MDLLDSFVPKRDKVNPRHYPLLGCKTLSIENTRVTFNTVQHGPDQLLFISSAHIMFEHDDVHSLKFRGVLEGEAIDLVTAEIKVGLKKREPPPPKPVPGTIGAAIHGLVEEARSVYNTHGDEFDLEDLKEAADWVEHHWNLKAAPPRAGLESRDGLLP